MKTGLATKEVEKLRKQQTVRQLKEKPAKYSGKARSKKRIKKK